MPPHDAADNPGPTLERPPPFDPTRATILLFLGSPRTGSTVLGQALNCHPSCLVATEARFLAGVLSGAETVDAALARVADRAWLQFHTGLEHDPHYAPTLHRFQSRWTGFAELRDHPALRKHAITLIGDKKAGGNIHAIRQFPDAFATFMQSRPNVRLLQITRHPIPAARSLMRSHGVATFEEACRRVVHDTIDSHIVLSQHNGRAITAYYEDLCDRPREMLHALLCNLNLTADPHWLSLIAARFQPAVAREEDAADYAIFLRILCEHAPTPALHRYTAPRSSLAA